MRQMADQNIGWGKWLGGAALGALVMYMLDPDRGAPRRAVSGERLRGLGKQTGKAFEKVVRDLGGRASAFIEPLIEPVIEHSGQASRAGGGSASAQTAGPAGLPRESAGAAAAGEHRPARPDGPFPTAGELLRPLMREARGEWRASTRSAAILGGGALGLAALVNRSPLAMLAGLAGLTLLARGVSNRPLGSLLASGRGARPLDTTLAIERDAVPPEPGRDDGSHSRVLH